MTGRQRLFTYVAAGLGVVVLGWLVVISSVFLFGGVATVSVVDHEEGFRFKAPIPMALVHAAVATAGSTSYFDLDDLELEIEGELGDLGEWGEVALGVLEVLDDAPNGTTFVSVNDGDEHVRVSKVRGKFRVDVETSEVTVRVAVPTRAVHRTVASIVR